ncbi:MAG: sigma-54-dependent Fis family transcriptional regulator [Deltaproteobacteria bacterium]|nr:MAG: sigma-54-dependent Fis family transcriptional regulator [Deltaproteobacteria bacterium]
METMESRPALRVLVVDDERNIRKTLVVCLQGLGCQVTEAGSPASALEALARAPHDVALVDLRLGREDGLDLLPRLLAERPGLDVVMITAYAAFDTAVEAIKRGAKDYLPKPFTPAQIKRVIEAARARRDLEQRLLDLEEQLADAAPEVSLETSSAPMRAVMEVVSRAAAHDVPVLLRGESGTGKSVLARALHRMSPRRDRPFFVVNCPALSEELLASEMFGHAKGAFTGAVRDRPGRVEAAEGGTLFLDEVGEIPGGIQVKLLRFLQDKQFERIGESRTRTANVRIVAATNRDLDVAVREGHFREDLLFRLNVVELTVPALRDRQDEILPLAFRFLAFFARAGRRAPPELTPEAEKALLAYPWPGNVRELRNAIERAVILSPGQRLAPEAFPDRIAAHAAGRPALGGDFTAEEIEREHVLRVLARSKTQEEAARILGLDSSTLWRKRRKYEDG